MGNNRPPHVSRKAKRKLPDEAASSKKVNRAKWIHSAINWWLALVLVLPFIFYRPLFDPLEPIRFTVLSAFLLAYTVFFYARRQRPAERLRSSGAELRTQLVDTIAAYNLTCSQRVLSFKDFSLTVKVLFGFGAGFMATMIIASARAINQPEALYRTLHFGIALLAAWLFPQAVMRESASLPRMVQALTVALLVHSFIAIGQFYGLLPQIFPDVAKPIGLMNNRNFLSSYIALMLPFGGLLAYFGGGSWKMMGGTSLFLGFYAIIIGQTRSIWLALFLAMVVAVVCVVWAIRRFEIRLNARGSAKTVAIAGIALVAIVLSVGLTRREGLSESLKQRLTGIGRIPGYITELFHSPKTVPTSSRNGQTSGSDDIADLSAGSRIFDWQKCGAVIREHPFLGVGPGNYFTAVKKQDYYGTNDWSYSRHTLIFPEWVHNVYLQHAAETGLLGLCCYLGMGIMAAIVAIGVVFKARNLDRSVIGILLLMVICIYAVDSFFSFPNASVVHSLVVGTALGLLIATYETTRKTEPGPLQIQTAQRYYFIAPACFLVLCGYVGCALMRGQSHLSMAMALMELNQNARAIKEIEAARNPLVALGFAGDSLDFFASEANLADGRFDEALTCAQRARRLDPWNPKIWLVIGDVYRNMRRNDDALQSYQEAYRLAPNFNNAWISLAQSYFQRGETGRCIGILAKSDYLEDSVSVQLLGAAYAKNKEDAKAIAVLRLGVGAYPESVELISQLAWLEFAGGEAENALAHFQKILKIQPNHPRRDDFVKAILSLKDKKKD